ncbi:MAG: class I SAM-dependent methyltransferase [Planctomycetota bacterium]
MERVNCALCGSRDKTPWRRIGGWVICRCTQCGFAYLNPRPTPEELEALLTEERIGGMYGGEIEREEIAPGAVADRLAAIAPFRGGGRLLDVGCGVGSFLVAAREQGWSVVGVEVLGYPAEKARAKLGNVVHVGDILEIDLPASSFDVITLWDSLEHMRDPSAVVRRMKILLKPDGALIVRAPNCGSFDAWVYGRNWPHWSLPLHMSHFTPMTLRNLLDRNGFVVGRMETKISTLVWSLRNLLRGRPGLADDAVQKGKGPCPALSAVPAARGESRSFRLIRGAFTGREVTAVARPR